MPQFTYGGRNRTPGIAAKVETFENEFLFGPYEAQFISGVVVDGAARDVGNTGNTHILRAGLLLGQNSTTKKLFEWDGAATDGTEYIWGILKESLTMLSNNTNTDRLNGLIVIAGGLLSKGLIVPGTTALGISANAMEHLIRQQLRMRFVLNDSYQYARPEFQIHTVTAAEQSGGITLAWIDSHRAYHNSGGTVTAALGALVAAKGIKYKFYAQTTTTDTITITSGSSNIIVPGSAAAASYTVDAAIVTIEGDGTNWVVESQDVSGLPSWTPNGAPDVVTDTAACSLTSYRSNLVTTTASVPTLADGVEGQLKKCVFITDVGDDVLTPANLTGGTTITFSAIGDYALLKFVAGSWVAIELGNILGTTATPVLA